MGKGEIARDEQFLLFPQCFLAREFGEFSAIFVQFQIAVCKHFQFGNGLGWEMVQPSLSPLLSLHTYSTLVSKLKSEVFYLYFSCNFPSKLCIICKLKPQQ